MNTPADRGYSPRPIEATAVAFSGFFLRESSWSQVRGAFARWICVDVCRNDPATTMNDYVDTALAAIASTPGPHVLLAHSFGGWLAATVASRMPTPPTHTILLGALGLSPGLSAAEHVAAAGSGTMSALCRLDLESGRIELTDEAAFQQLLGADSGTWPEISPCEPVALLTEALEADVMRHRTADSRRWYVIAGDDALANTDAQRTAAIQHGAKVLRCEGGHLAALRNPRWMDAIEWQ